MNTQGSKKIIFNKSTLLNLKAELLKKQEEVQGKKRLPQHKIENFKPSPAKPADNEEKDQKTKKSFKDSLKEVDMDELAQYKKTKAALEKKAELYEHLSNPIGKSQLSSKFLVDFNSKKQENQNFTSVSESITKEKIEEESIEDIQNFEDDSEWTEFTDCLGRTRKCLKSDLVLFKEKDQALLNSLKKEENNISESGEMMDLQKTKPFLVQQTNDYLQTLREKWEQKEKELLAKDEDIHYQDLLFDEARMHGVSYYSFSTDERTRRKQMEELLKTREETLRAQARAEEKRRQQEEQLAAREKAAIALQRMRQGLPPEEAEENQKDFNTLLLELLNKQKEEAEARAKEQERKIKEQIEQERQKLREAYVREWDRGKEGVKDEPTKFRELSQEEYVEQQRAKRIDEFAPPQASSSSKLNNFFDGNGRKVTDNKSQSCTWDSVRPKPKTPPPPEISEYDINETKGLFFSTAKKQQPNLKYKNFVKTQEPTPIENELSDDDNEINPNHSKPEKRKLNSNTAEVPPPPTYEYYGPSSKHHKSQKPFDSDMREAFAQGTKSLETKTKTLHLPQKYDFTFE